MLHVWVIALIGLPIKLFSIIERSSSVKVCTCINLVQRVGGLITNGAAFIIVILLRVTVTVALAIYVTSIIPVPTTIVI